MQLIVVPMGKANFDRKPFEDEVLESFCLVACSSLVIMCPVLMLM